MLKPKIKLSGIVFTCLFLLILLLNGCTIVKETTRSIAGTSTKELEQARKDAIKGEFEYGYADCYNKVKETLKSIGGYIYSEDEEEGLIAAYISETDTTAVGVFLKEAGLNKTEVEVSSPSTFGKEFISEKIFSVLEGKITVEELQRRRKAKEENEETDNK